MRILTRTTAVVVLALTALLALPAVAFASSHAEDVPGESNLGFLMVGLILLWAGFFAYVFYLSRKTNDLRREIDDLRDQMFSDGDDV